MQGILVYIRRRCILPACGNALSGKHIHPLLRQNPSLLCKTQLRFCTSSAFRMYVSNLCLVSEVLSEVLAARWYMPPIHLLCTQPVPTFCERQPLQYRECTETSIGHLRTQPWRLTVTFICNVLIPQSSSLRAECTGNHLR